MQDRAAAGHLLPRHGRIRHWARTFLHAPDLAQCLALLDELAAAPCLFSPVAADRPIALYGAGNLGRMAREFLDSVGAEIAVVLDTEAARIAQNPFWSGIQVLRPHAMPPSIRSRLRLAVCVVTSPYVPIERTLVEHGFEDVVPFYDLAECFRGIHPLSNGWFAGPLSSLDRRNIGDVLARWHDDASRAHHLQFLAWRRLREEWSFESAPIPGCERFFIPEVVDVLTGQERFVDAGAHEGMVIKTFLDRTQGRFESIIAVEPDPANRARLQTNLQSWTSGTTVTVHDCALADSKGDALFHAGLGYASQLSPTGRLRVTTHRLDDLGLSPTFMKLHLEGAELGALKGARETMLAHRPIVAATIYHNDDGIWKTPLWLMTALPDYRFLFRLHGWCGTGAVIYAIPKERISQ